MIADVLIRRYGSPHFRLVGFHLWVHGYQFPKRDDYYEGNWLTATVCCEFEGSVAWVEQAPCLETHDFPHFVQRLERLLAGGRRRAGVFPNATGFYLMLGKGAAEETFEVKAEITPRGLCGRSTLVELINQYEYVVGVETLEDAYRQARALAERWPVRGTRPPARERQWP